VAGFVQVRGVLVEGVILFLVCVMVLLTAHKVIGKFAIVLYVLAFFVALVAAAKWLEVHPYVLLYWILGGAVAVVLVIVLIGYKKGL
jgi:hypothetical protein